MSSIFGSKGGKQSSNTTSTGSGFTNSYGISDSSSRTTPGMTKEMSDVYDAIASGRSVYSKQNAITDVQGVLRQQATDALQTVMPTIARQESSAGAYNSTTKDLLKNDASARITSQLAETQLNAINNYGKMEQGFLSSMADVVKATTTQESNSTSRQASNSEYSQDSTTNSSGKTGGSGLLGLFADGGQVLTNPIADKIQEDIKKQATGEDSYMSDIFDNIGGYAKNKIDGSAEMKEAEALMELVKLIGFADGGQVPSSIKDSQQNGFFANTRARREQEAGLSEPQGGVTINVNTGGGSGSGGQPQEPKRQTSDGFLQKLREIAGFANGGQVPGPGDSEEAEKLLRALRHYANGGDVRSGQSDVQAGGKIRGPQSNTGEDNQVIGVAGGEGILPKDVMDVPGVPELVKSLIQKYHTPVN